MVIVAVLMVAYLVIVGPARHLIPNSVPVPWYKKLSFVVGLSTFYLGFFGPVYLIGHLMFSFHMFKMALVYFIAPPLLMFGTPAWLLRPLFRKSGTIRFVRTIMNPVLGLVLFNLFLSLYHIPAVFDGLMANYGWHIGYQAFLFVAAVYMWWQVLTPLPEFDRLSEIKKIAYVFANSAMLIPACALIIFADHTIYETYIDPNLWATTLGYCLPAGTSVPPEMFDTFNLLNPMEDQQLGGIVMKLTQETAFMITLMHIFFHWVRKEKKVMDIQEYKRHPGYIQ